MRSWTVTTEESSTVLDLLKVSIEEGISLGIILADIQEQLSVNSPQPPIALDQQETSKNGRLNLSQLDNPLVPIYLIFFLYRCTRSLGIWCYLQA